MNHRTNRKVTNNRQQQQQQQLCSSSCQTGVIVLTEQQPHVPPQQSSRIHAQARRTHTTDPDCSRFQIHTHTVSLFLPPSLSLLHSMFLNRVLARSLAPNNTKIHLTSTRQRYTHSLHTYIPACCRRRRPRRGTFGRARCRGAISRCRWHPGSQG